MSRYVVLPWGIVVAVVAITLAFVLLTYIGWDRWSYE